MDIVGKFEKQVRYIPLLYPSIFLLLAIDTQKK